MNSGAFSKWIFIDEWENVFKFVIFIEYKYLIFLLRFAASLFSTFFVVVVVTLLDLSFIYYCVHLNMSFNMNEIYLLFIWWEIQIKSWDDVKNVYGFCVCLRHFHLWFFFMLNGLACVWCMYVQYNILYMRLSWIEKLFEIDEFLLLTTSVLDVYFCELLENWSVSVRCCCCVLQIWNFLQEIREKKKLTNKVASSLIYLNLHPIWIYSSPSVFTTFDSLHHCAIPLITVFFFLFDRLSTGFLLPI